MQALIRLLHFDSGKLTYTVFKSPHPPYAILSHVWITPSEDEFLFSDLAAGTGHTKPGYRKILFCGEQVKRDNLKYFWVDTCCNDKYNRRELENSINSMFRWYRNAARCYTLLADVSAGMEDWEAALKAGWWFKHGWTLQELIAPLLVEFFSKEGQLLGDKQTLESLIHDVTRSQFQSFEVISWMISAWKSGWHGCKAEKQRNRKTLPTR